MFCGHTRPRRWREPLNSRTGRNNAITPVQTHRLAFTAWFGRSRRRVDLEACRRRITRLPDGHGQRARPAAFRSNLDLVTVTCTGGRPARDEFDVYDNGVRRIIENLSFDTSAALTLGDIISASDSQREQIDEHR